MFLKEEKMVVVEILIIKFNSAKTINRKVQGVPQSQTAANPRHQEEEKNDKKVARTKQTNKCTRSKQTSSLIPKRGDHNAKKNEETRGQRAREDFKT